MIDHGVPFYANTSDDTHCFQAAIRMVLKYFKPQEDYTWEELDTITAKVEGLWTWPLAGLLWLKDRGFEVVVVENFDYLEFAERGEAYLSDLLGKEVADAQVAHSNIAQEQRFAEIFHERRIYQSRIPEIADIQSFLRDGFICICNVNSRKLNNKEGYVGHFVVIKGFDGDGIKLHDPGLPPLENRTVSYDAFEKAWSFPNSSAKNIMAIRFGRIDAQ